MKLNRSLAISTCIQECKMGNIIGLLENEFPSDILENLPEKENSRNRIFTPGNTLLTMVLTATQKDKTLKNSVDLYYMIHQKNKKEALVALESMMEEERRMDLEGEKKPGRPKKYAVQLPKSLEKDISLNTAGYSKARDRVSPALAQKLFHASRLLNAENTYSHWHGYHVMIADGTYLQLQDTKSIRKDFEVKAEGETQGYPQALLEVILDRGTGQLYDFRMASRNESELPLFHQMIQGLPATSLILLDDLYNCYEIIAACKRQGVELVVPAKRKRNFQVVEQLAPGDDIIRISAPEVRSQWVDSPDKASEVLLRRIECVSPTGKPYVLHTTLLDKHIDKQEIQTLYVTRWDIEIGIREIKTIMDINILRSKTPEMALKELTIALATYNLLRKIIYASIKSLPFSPKEDFIYRFYTLNKDILIDKKGRVYNRWSTGRRPAETDDM
jgi:hypothetical protein